MVEPRTYTLCYILGPAIPSAPWFYYNTKYYSVKTKGNALILFIITTLINLALICLFKKRQTIS